MKIRGTHILMAWSPLLLASFYGTWLAGRVSLGYWPRPLLDDPKYIEGFWMWTYAFTMIVLRVGFPVALVLAAISVVRPLIKKSPEWKVRLLEAVGGIVLFGLFIAFAQWDPQGVFNWYFD